MRFSKYCVRFLLIIFLICSLFAIYINAGKKLISCKTYEHISAEGSKNAVASIEVRHSFLNIFLSYDEWIIRVIYKDEPNAIYFYTYKNRSIVATGVSGSSKYNDYKHLEPN